MVGERGPEHRWGEQRLDDLVARLRDLEERNRQLTTALSIARRQVAFYRRYCALMQEAIGQAITSALQVGGENLTPNKLPESDMLRDYAASGLDAYSGKSTGVEAAAGQARGHLSLEEQIANLAQELAELRELMVTRKAQQSSDGPNHVQKPPIVPGRSPDDSRVEALTRREIDVLRLMAQGLDNREIANRLFISEKTVKSHVTAIFGKLQVADRTQAVIYALRHGLA